VSCSHTKLVLAPDTATGQLHARAVTTDNRNKGTDNRNKGTDNRNKGTDNRNSGQLHSRAVTLKPTAAARRNGGGGGGGGARQNGRRTSGAMR
jgi:hypothetical protein